MNSIGDLARSAFNGFEIVGSWSALIPVYNTETGWELDYPHVDEWHERTLVAMHLQDFVTVVNGRCLELEAIENHFGNRSNQVIVINWTMDLEKIYTGPLNLMYFPWHSYQLLANLKDTRNDWQPQLESPRPTNWQCLNGTTRRHRRLIVDYLQDRYANGILSFGNKIPLPEWDFSTYKGCENEVNWMRLLPIYSQCNTNIVTETFYYTMGIITEKTLMAFLGLQIPIVIGHKGIVEQLERHGFDMFTDLVDTTYDTVDDDIRWVQAIELNRGVINYCYDRKDYLDRLKKNRDYALEVWPKLLVDQFNSSAQDIQQNLHQSS